MYKIRKELTGINSPFYLNVATLHLPRPASSLVEPLEELPIIEVEL